jgi:hypothetical protein
VDNEKTAQLSGFFWRRKCADRDHFIFKTLAPGVDSNLSFGFRSIKYPGTNPLEEA